MGSLGVPIHLREARAGVSAMRRARARLRRWLAIWLTTASTVGHIVTG
jgi:hypothetical protein